LPKPAAAAQQEKPRKDAQEQLCNRCSRVAIPTMISVMRQCKKSVRVWYGHRNILRPRRVARTYRDLIRITASSSRASRMQTCRSAFRAGKIHVSLAQPTPLGQDICGRIPACGKQHVAVIKEGISHCSGDELSPYAVKSSTRHIAGGSM